jgi:hypothetical protein
MSAVRVRLNVGGTTFETSEQTLLKYANTFFSALLAALHTPGHIQLADYDGRVFVDRDPKHFADLLKFLRCATVVPGKLEYCTGEGEASTSCPGWHGRASMVRLEGGR